MRFLLIFVFILTTISILSCTNMRGKSVFGPESSLFGGGRATSAGPLTNIEPVKEFEKINLISLLDPKEEYKQHTKNKFLNYEEKLWLATQTFYKHTGIFPDEYTILKKIGSDPNIKYQINIDSTPVDRNIIFDNLKIRRNEVQSRIIAASNQRCTVYLSHLWRLDTNVNFLLGSATTILGSLGGIFKAEEAARALSAAAGITSGVRGEFNKAFFAITADIITKGIEDRREEEIEMIRYKQHCEPIDKYGVLAAIADAVKYHGACHALVGLQESELTLDEARARKKSGLDISRKTVSDINAFRNMVIKQEVINAKIKRLRERIEEEAQKEKDGKGGNPSQYENELIQSLSDYSIIDTNISQGLKGKNSQRQSRNSFQINCNNPPQN
ncbi:MAG: hypothetical protein GTO02_08460 [Candidatus Dadabacteria bacterium]|nr:hypothetical protein [Candidatus Dadabacteria bacterium]NIQ14419.1 hypothetical protein [Candidatus Dadabacteria bacterium]